MKAVVSASADLATAGRRLDASYHASDGVLAARCVRRWEAGRNSDTQGSRAACEPAGTYRTGGRLQTLADVCVNNGIFIPSRFKRIFVDDPQHGVPYLTGGSILQADPLAGAKHISRRFTSNLEELALRERMILVTCSGTVGNSVYVNGCFGEAVGSPDLLRVVADPAKVPPGYLYAFLTSPMGKALITQQTYGAVVPHVEAHHVVGLPIPRLDRDTEERIHELIEHAAALRTRAGARLEESKRRFQREVLGLDPDLHSWRYGNEHARGIGVAWVQTQRPRLDAFHHIGYAAEPEALLGSRVCLGELVRPYQPPQFKRPYAGNGAMPFLSGIDLYDAYPKPHMYISRRMPNLDRYIVEAGTVVVQRVGQRYGLFGRPTILPRHLDGVAVTEHLMRLHPMAASDRGFIYIWLATDCGRRLLLRQSCGTSMVVLSERSFSEMPVPVAESALRATFERDVAAAHADRDEANNLEEQAQAALREALEIKSGI